MPHTSITWKCAVSENIHTSPTEGIGLFWGVGASERPKNLKKCMKLNWKFQKGGGGGGGVLRYFLELHNSKCSGFQTKCAINKAVKL